LVSFSCDSEVSSPPTSNQTTFPGFLFVFHEAKEDREGKEWKWRRGMGQFYMVSPRPSPVLSKATFLSQSNPIFFCAKQLKGGMV
jgi:hypothetical protein